MQAGRVLKALAEPVFNDVTGLGVTFPQTFPAGSTAARRSAQASSALQNTFALLVHGSSSRQPGKGLGPGHAAGDKHFLCYGAFAVDEGDKVDHAAHSNGAFFRVFTSKDLHGSPEVTHAQTSSAPPLHDDAHDCKSRVSSSCTRQHDACRWDDADVTGGELSLFSGFAA